MFITSFIPLWTSIVISNAWGVCYEGRKDWRDSVGFCKNLEIVAMNNKATLVFTVVILTVLAISICEILCFIKEQKKSTNKKELIVTKARANKSLSSDFLLAYILPMVTFDFSELKGIVLFIICFTTLAYLCVRNNNIYINILLELMGYHMFTCDLKINVNGNSYQRDDVLVISKEDLTARIDNEISCYDFDKYIYIDLKGD